MGIELGLFRIKSLLNHLGNPQLSNWRVAAHVAGTNGKGSVCSYISNTLSKVPGLKVGKFTSPHLISVNDSICVNEMPVSRQKYDFHKSKVCQVNKLYNINATEFEIHTAVAFDLFNSENIDFAVLEVGLGGKLDSTNVIPGFNPESQKHYGVLVTGITKIAMDHESILGSTLQEIASQKAGIIKPKVPCVIDASNSQSVIDTVETIAENNNSPLILADKDDYESSKFLNSDTNSPLKLENIKSSYQYNNISIAVNMLLQLRSQLYNSQSCPKDIQIAKKITPELIHNGISSTTWPGRLQSLNFNFSRKGNTAQTIPILLDGAHNESAAIELKKYIDDNYGYKKEPITYILSMTSTKNIGKILKPILKDCGNKNFNIILTNFDYSHGVEDMPWIKSYDSKLLKKFITDNLLIDPSKITIIEDVHKVFTKNDFSDRNVIVFGSLYLAGEILRIHKSFI